MIPFPYADGGFSGSAERWVIEQEGFPNKLVLNVIYKDKIVASFPVTAGTNDSSGSIKLSGKEYDIISITLNSDQVSDSVKSKKKISVYPYKNYTEKGVGPAGLPETWGIKQFI